MSESLKPRQQLEHPGWAEVFPEQELVKGGIYLLDGDVDLVGNKGQTHIAMTGKGTVEVMVVGPDGYVVRAVKPSGFPGGLVLGFLSKEERKKTRLFESQPTIKN